MIQTKSNEHYVFRLYRHRSKRSAHQIEALAQFIRYWCEANCNGPWRVDLDDDFLIVTIGTQSEAVHFRFSDECSYFDAADMFID